MPVTPTQRTLKELRKRGYRCQVVEHWNAFARRSIDLFECIDVLACGNGGNLGVQATSWSNVSARRNKIMGLIVEDKPIAEWVRTPGNKLEIWGWRQGDDGPELRVEEVTIEPGGSL